MINIEILFEVIVLGLFALSMLFHARALMSYRYSSMPESMLIVMYYGSSLAILICGLHIILGVEWMIDTYEQGGGGDTDWAWIVYQYLLAIYMIMVPTSARLVALKYPDKDESEETSGEPE